MRLAATLAAVSGVVCALIVFDDGAAHADVPGSVVNSVNACLHYSQEPDDPNRKVMFQVENSCAASYACVISWEVTCKTRTLGNLKKRYSETSRIEAHETKQWFGSAETCGEDEEYVISAPRWSCRGPGR